MSQEFKTIKNLLFELDKSKFIDTVVQREELLEMLKSLYTTHEPRNYDTALGQFSEYVNVDYNNVKRKLGTRIRWVDNGSDYVSIENNYNWEVDYNVSRTVDKDYIKVWNNIRLGRFTRRSKGKQSAYSVEDIINNTSNKNGILFFAEDSSSFKDFAFLRFLQYCKENQIREVEAFSFTRSAYETVTRSYENGLLLLKWIDENLEFFDNINVGGLNLLDLTQRSVFLVLVSVLEGKWLHNANTRYYDKHDNYKLVLEGLKPKKWLDNDDVKGDSKEFTAFMNYNKTAENFSDFLGYLKAQSLRPAK
jgi:hypothetical protein